MGFLSFSVFSLWMLAVAVAVAADVPQPTTVHSEVVAINKIIDHFNLRSKLNITGVDPCTPNATWSTEDANPKVVCDCSNKTACHITELKIYALDIKGTLPTELFDLTKLTNLDLGQNVLSGPIPPAIGKLSEMQYMTFGINNLSGSLPVELGKLTKLISLGLGSNRFNGALPSELKNLASLEQLYIDSGGFSGPFPQSISNMANLRKLWASDNAFTGKIPEFLGNLTGFTVLRLEGTNLEGPIPSKFSALTNLLDLRISDLLGESTKSLDFIGKLTQLSTLSLRSCRINCQIPKTLSSLPKLMLLDLSFNKLQGQIPASFKKLTKLKYLFLGSNNLTGRLNNTDLIREPLLALDVSFNPLTGKLPPDRKNVAINVVGTSIDDTNLNKTAVNMLHCLQGITKCTMSNSTSFAVNCGGKTSIISTPYNTTFDEDSETLLAASLFASNGSRWAVSNNGFFADNIKGSQDKISTGSQNSQTLDSELYKTARISASSLRYYGLGLKNGKYNVDLHFAEIQMDDSSSNSWKGLGQRLFDVYIQGERVLEDFNIVNKAGGSMRALVMTFEANVTNTVIDIHFYWAGKGTCCIPAQSIYGPLVSAVHVRPKGKSI